MKKMPLKGLLTKKHIAENAKQVNLPLLVRMQTTVRETNVRQLSLLMGGGPAFLSRALKRKDHHISLLIAMSIHLQKNLLDPYLQLLPPQLRATQRERELLQQVDDMEKQLLQLIEERNMFRDAVLRK